MPPVFGPAVAVADALEVLRGRERPRRLAVAEREQRDLVADEQLLDDDRATRLAERPADEAGLDRGERRRAVRADGDALAGREPVGLDDAGAAELVDGAARGLDVGARPRRAPSARRPPASAPSRTPSSPRRARRPTTARRPRCARAAARRRARARAAARARSRRARPRGGGRARRARRGRRRRRRDRSRRARCRGCRARSAVRYRWGSRRAPAPARAPARPSRRAGSSSRRVY